MLPKLVMQFSGKTTGERRLILRQVLKYILTAMCDPLQIVHGWGQYFSNMYSDTYRKHYDVEFQSYVEEKDQTITSELPASCRSRDTACISVDVVVNALKCMTTKKACRPDKVYDKHLIYGGSVLYEKLAKFYTDMYKYGFVPMPFKEGIIITLHKCGRKSKTDPNSYRAITLSSAILKVKR